MLRGDGVGIEIADGVVRAIRLRHDVRGRIAATAELPFVSYDDGAALDSLVLLRAELGQPTEPTRLATFPSPILAQVAALPKPQKNPSIGVITGTQSTLLQKKVSARFLRTHRDRTAFATAVGSGRHPGRDPADGPGFGHRRRAPERPDVSKGSGDRGDLLRFNPSRSE